MRPNDWPVLLDGYIQNAAREPFAWGTHDCVSFVCGWHRLMTGRDVYEEFRGGYESEFEAKKLMLVNGVRSMSDAGRYLFGEAKVPLRAQRGDIVLAENALGICVNGSAAVLGLNSLGQHGVIMLDQRDFILAWTV